METKYSKEQFEGFTHRFIVKFKVDEDWRNDVNITLYSNSDSYQKLEDFINNKKSNKVISFSIEHRASKEQDELASKFLNEMLVEKEYLESKKIVQEYESIYTVNDSADRYTKKLDKDWDDDIYTIEEWDNAVNDGWITNDDGSGYWIKDGLKSKDEVFSTPQLDATHVVWYNK